VADHNGLNGRYEVPHLCMVTFTSQVRTHATKSAYNLSKPKLTNAIWGAGLSFSKCHAELKVPVDPHTPGIFDEEEFNRAARFWTYGYDIYTPNRVYVLHDYTGSQQHNPHAQSWGSVICPSRRGTTRRTGSVLFTPFEMSSLRRTVPWGCITLSNRLLEMIPGSRPPSRWCILSPSNSQLTD